jgi:hypothetical protein
VANRPEVPLLCKEGRRGGRSVEWEHVVSTLQLAANGTTLPHLNPPLTKGRNGILEKALGINTHGKPGSNKKYGCRISNVGRQWL